MRLTWCEDCRHWRAGERNPAGRPLRGECHRMAPAAAAPTMQPDPALWAVWPATLPDESCGEWVERAA